MTHARILRWLLLGLAVVAAFGAYAVILLGSDMARAFPEFPNLGWLTVAATVGIAGLSAATLATLYGLLRLVDRGQAFSDRTVTMLGRLKALFAVAAGFVTVAAAAAWLLIQPHVGLIVCWGMAEVPVLFLMVLAALLQRLFAAAVQLRQDVESTV